MLLQLSFYALFLFSCDQLLLLGVICLIDCFELVVVAATTDFYAIGFER
jgi:hypothetical protein